jgi:TonB family protein
MSGRGVSLAAALAALIIVVAGTEADAKDSTGNWATFTPPVAPAPFDHVRTKIAQARGATVAVVCGTTVAPWAYRGPRGDSLELKARIRTEQGRPWGESFARVLMKEADWDSTHRFRGRSRFCREAHDVPLFVVGWHGGMSDEVYALIDFESRCARMFSVNRPLGTVWFKDRADQLFTLVHDALARDPAVASMTLPAESAASSNAPALRESVWVEKLPNATHKVAPEYPRKAQEHGWEGTVKIQALVGEDGAIHDAFVMESVGGLDDAALAAVWDWKFEPAQGRDGTPVAVWVIVPVKFSLK